MTVVVVMASSGAASNAIDIVRAASRSVVERVFIVVCVVVRLSS